MNYGFLGIKAESKIASEPVQHVIGRSEDLIAVSIVPMPMLSPELQLRKALSDGLLVVYGARRTPLEVRYGRLFQGARIQEVGLDDPVLASRAKLAQLEVVHRAVAQLCTQWPEWKQAAEKQGRVRMEDIDELVE